jgi:hypothetical protein
LPEVDERQSCSFLFSTFCCRATERSRKSVFLTDQPIVAQPVKNGMVFAESTLKFFCISVKRTRSRAVDGLGLRYLITHSTRHIRQYQSSMVQNLISIALSRPIRGGGPEESLHLPTHRVYHIPYCNSVEKCDQFYSPIRTSISEAPHWRQLCHNEIQPLILPQCWLVIRLINRRIETQWCCPWPGFTGGSSASTFNASP